MQCRLELVDTGNWEIVLGDLGCRLLRKGAVVDSAYTRRSRVVRAAGIETTTHGLEICGEGAKTENPDCIIRSMRERRPVLTG